MDLGAILDFVDSGHDLIITTDASASGLIRSIATDCGVDFDEVSMECMNEVFRGCVLFSLRLYLFLSSNFALGSVGYGY